MWLLLSLACTEPLAPPEVHHTAEVAASLAHQGIATWPVDNTPFDWIPTVWHYGLTVAAEHSEDDVYDEHVRAWLEADLASYQSGTAAPFVSSDEMSPALLASERMVVDSGRDYTAMINHAHSYLADVPRTSDGGIPHWGREFPWGNEHQMWLDSLFMWGLFLLSEHDRTGDPVHLETWTTQYLLFSAHCRDPSDQLYRHAWDDEQQVNIPVEATYWARGNSWVLVSAAEALLRNGIDDPALAQVLPLFVAHADAFVATQAADGMWHTVLNAPNGDDPANYTETSAAALIAYGLALGIKSGALDAATYGPTLDAAVAGVQTRLRQGSDGSYELAGTSFGTNTGNYEYYISVEQGDFLMLGVGSAVLMLAEVDGMEKTP